MQVIDIPLVQLKEAPWNPNQMDDAVLSKLRASVSRYGLVENLVVRPLDDGTYEVLSGNHRIQTLKELGYFEAPCLVIHLDDAQSRLMAQALNHIHGEDDPGLRAQVLRELLATLPREEVLAVLPETPASLQSLASIGTETMAAYLANWQKAQEVKLKHKTFQLTSAQLEIVEQALEQVLPLAKEEKGASPNLQGTALYLLCKEYLELRSEGR